MKRSEINSLIQDALVFFKEKNFILPPWATWAPGDWKGKKQVASEIADNMLGWDLTDFGSGDFLKHGLLLFTVRNGNLKKKHPKTYAEKIMVVRDGQETPHHFHWFKMEDIINRGGGKLVLELHASTRDEGLSKEGFSVRVDGVEKNLRGGDRVTLEPGESICLPTGLYHRFWGEGKTLVGEVSMANDDATDNRFLETIGRFPAIEEDEAPIHLLVTDYPRYF